jgi:hypothetical protein
MVLAYMCIVFWLQTTNAWSDFPVEAKVVRTTVYSDKSVLNNRLIRTSVSNNRLFGQRCFAQPFIRTKMFWTTVYSDKSVSNNRLFGLILFRFIWRILEAGKTEKRKPLHGLPHIYFHCQQKEHKLNNRTQRFNNLSLSPLSVPFSSAFLSQLT